MHTAFRFLLLTVLTLAVSCGKTQKSQCRKDTDCKGDRICEKGVCTEPRLRPAPPPDDPDPAPDPDPQAALPQMPRVPQLPQLPPLPQLAIPGFSIGPGGAFNLKFDLKVGQEDHTIELVPSGTQPVLRWCVNRKCEDLDLSSPGDLQRVLDRLASTAGANDPQLREFLRMLKDVSGLLNAAGGLGGPAGGGGGGAPPFVNTPSGPQSSGVFHSCEEILAAGTGAEGGTADIEELVPTIVSSDEVTFKGPGGVVLELQVPPKLQGKTPLLAKTQNAVAVRFKILRVAQKYIRGEMQQVQVQ